MANLVKKNQGTGIAISGNENLVQENVIVKNEEGNIEDTGTSNTVFCNKTGNAS